MSAAIIVDVHEDLGSLVVLVVLVADDGKLIACDHRLARPIIDDLADGTTPEIGYAPCQWIGTLA